MNFNEHFPLLVSSLRNGDFKLKERFLDTEKEVEAFIDLNRSVMRFFTHEEFLESIEKVESPDGRWSAYFSFASSHSVFQSLGLSLEQMIFLVVGKVFTVKITPEDYEQGLIGLKAKIMDFQAKIKADLNELRDGLITIMPSADGNTLDKCFPEKNVGTKGEVELSRGSITLEIVLSPIEIFINQKGTDSPINLTGFMRNPDTLLSEQISAAMIDLHVKITQALEGLMDPA